MAPNAIGRRELHEIPLRIQATTCGRDPDFVEVMVDAKCPEFAKFVGESFLDAIFGDIPEGAVRECVCYVEQHSNNCVAAHDQQLDLHCHVVIVLDPRCAVSKSTLKTRLEAVLCTCGGVLHRTDGSVAKKPGDRRAHDHRDGLGRCLWSYMMHGGAYAGVQGKGGVQVSVWDVAHDANGMLCPQTNNTKTAQLYAALNYENMKDGVRKPPPLSRWSKREEETGRPLIDDMIDPANMPRGGRGQMRPSAYMAIASLGSALGATGPQQVAAKLKSFKGTDEERGRLADKAEVALKSMLSAPHGTARVMQFSAAMRKPEVDERDMQAAIMRGAQQSSLDDLQGARGVVASLSEEFLMDSDSYPENLVQEGVEEARASALARLRKWMGENKLLPEPQDSMARGLVRVANPEKFTPQDLKSQHICMRASNGNAGMTAAMTVLFETVAGVYTKNLHVGSESSGSRFLLDNTCASDRIFLIDGASAEALTKNMAILNKVTDPGPSDGFEVKGQHGGISLSSRARLVVIATKAQAAELEQGTSVRKAVSEGPSDGARGPSAAFRPPRPAAAAAGDKRRVDSASALLDAFMARKMQRVQSPAKSSFAARFTVFDIDESPFGKLLMLPGAERYPDAHDLNTAAAVYQYNLHKFGDMELRGPGLPTLEEIKAPLLTVKERDFESPGLAWLKQKSAGRVAAGAGPSGTVSVGAQRSAAQRSAASTVALGRAPAARAAARAPVPVRPSVQAPAPAPAAPSPAAPSVIEETPEEHLEVAPRDLREEFEMAAEVVAETPSGPLYSMSGPSALDVPALEDESGPGSS